MDGLSGRAVLVTGAASGIGRASAAAFARAGASLAVLLTTTVPQLSSRLRAGPPAADVGGSDQTE
jgi:2,3-dihydro-2,3-dihydroxybenzoate dehydrogenase